MLAAVLILVSGFRLVPAPPGAGELERLQCVIRTTSIALVGLKFGRAGVALLVVLLLVHQRPFLAEAESAVVLGLEAAELLRELVPGEGLGAVRARPFEHDEPAHDGRGLGLDGPRGRVADGGARGQGRDRSRGRGGKGGGFRWRKSADPPVRDRQRSVCSL